MESLKPNPVETLILCSLTLLCCYLVFIEDISDPFYRHLLDEDQFVEWLTVSVLFAALSLLIYRFIIFKLYKSRPAAIMFTLINIGLIIVIAEEISWGQRIFYIESSEFFLKYNKQNETNFHNLQLGRHSVNMALFGLAFQMIVLVYLLVFPVLYTEWQRFRNFVNYWHVPVPRIYQAISYVLCMRLVLWLDYHRKWEVHELVLVTIAFVVLMRPLNNIFEVEEKLPQK